MRARGKQWISLLLTLCMALTMLPAISVPAVAAGGNCTGNHDSWTELSGNKELKSLSGDCVLTGDVIVTGTDKGNIEIKSPVTLCLNGHTLNLNGSNSFRIYENGSLTLCDCKGSGKITNSQSTVAPGVIVDGGSFTMNGGSIAGTGGGAVQVNSGSFMMTGGSITRNTCTGGTTNYIPCGGVLVSGGSFTMTGGKITGNTATGNVATAASGGVLVVNQGSSFTMTGGEITNNQCTVKQMILNGKPAGGVCVSDFLSGGTFTVSGKAVIAGNTANGSASNVSTGQNAKISIGGVLSSGTSIGVTRAANDPFTSGWSTYMSGKSPTDYFFSDAAGNVAKLSGSEVILTPGYTVTFDSTGGSAVPSQGLTSGEQIVRPADPTREGYTFAEWYQEQACTNLWDFDQDTVSGNMTLYAKWVPNTATPPAITTGGGLTQTYGTAGGNISVSVESVTDHTYTYQWYENTTDSNTGGTAIVGATGSGYPIPATTGAGTHYYYCVVTASRSGASEPASTASDVITVDISKAALTPAATANDKVYDGTVSATGDITLSCAVNGESPTASGTFAFENANVGENKTVYVTDITLTSNWGKNYRLSDTSTATTASITARAFGVDFTIEEIPDQSYTGSKIEPEDVTITFNGKTLTKGTDYTLSYGDNINAGTNAGSVIIEFKGNFSGKTTVYFDIVYADLPSGTDLDDYVTIPAPNENGWYKQDITLTPKAGVTIGTTDAATGGVTISTEGTDKQVVFIKDGDQTYKTEFEYQLDKTDPTVSDLTAETGGWTADDVIVSFTASDVPSGIDGVTVSKDGGTAQTVTDSGSDYSFPADSNGTYTVTVTDKAGNTTTKEITISNIDKTDPGLTVSGGDMGAASLTLKAEATQNGGSLVTVTAKDSSNNVLTANGDGSYTITEPGEYTFTATTGAGVTTTVTKTVYSITFDRNGGSPVDRQLVVSGGKVTKPADPTRNGYAFDCWQNNGTDWEFESDTVTTGLTLTAAWTLNKPTVTLTPDKDSATYNNGETVITLTAAASHAASGNITYTYEWYKGTTKLSNDASTLTLSTVADTGSYTVKVTAEDSDALIAEKTSDAVAVAIQKAAPVLTVSAAEITYGDSLSHSRLTGAASHNGKNVVGSFAWQSEATKPAVSDSGATEYTVVFTPGDQDNYTDATAAITLTVNRRELTPTVASVNDKVYDGNTSTTGTIALSGGVGEEMPTASGVFTFVNANAGENKRVNVTGITLDGSWGDNYALSVDHLENKASTGSIAKRPVELSWSKNSFTYDGTEKTVTATVTNAAVQTDTFVLKYTGNTQTAAGENYQAAVTALGNPNYTLTDGTNLTHDWTIGKKTITGTWQGLSQVYGDNTKVKLLLDGLVEGDEKVQAHITGGGSDAGRYELTATLDNYEITNDTAILVIEKKPVVISVTDNAVTPGGEPQVNVPDVPAEDYEVIYKDKDGNEADLSKPGNYEVWVKFPENSNYRHPNGSTEAPVGSVTVSETKPARYTVTFDGNGTTSDTMPDLELAGGSVLTLPECSYAKTDAQFTGWQYGGKTYKPGDRFTMPYGDMTFTAQWQAVFEVSGTIKEETGSGEQNTGNAVVSLWLGANKIAETHTEADGTYHFEDLLPGIYNLVVTKDERTVTKKAIIEDENAEDCSAILPQYVTNSIVDVKPGSPDIVVGELDGAFTENDISAAQSGSKVEITFKADERQEAEVEEETVKNLQSAGGSNLSLFLDCTLIKTVTTGSSTSETELSQSSILLEVRLPLPAELQGKYGYTVSRMHGGEAQSLGTEANDLGEYFEVSDDKTVLTLHVCCFSTYAVGYRNAPSTPTYPPVKNESENGSITVSPSRPTAGQTVTITPKPDEGYEVDRVLVVDRNGQEVEVTPGADGTYRFTQPRGSVTITVTFQKSISASDCPRDGSCPLAAFTDVDRNAWYHDGAHYCVAQGLMQGYGSLFGPDEALSRGMLVQILYNLENHPAVSGQSAFEDVVDGAWYADAVNWAASQGIVKGYDNGNYGPDDPITREQLAAMLHRYAKYRGYDVRVGEDSNILSYRDAEEISGYAIPAMQWACGVGLITGTPDAALVPAGTATRAQAAAILMRFVEYME